ncbi:MAG TPA: histidine kinase dimerization/phosphoacceptor domain -containing protein [Gracilimonas sp.]|uniref:histidine kinase dimerization/phosphoacceptor domain -containing protein n=1 Tax=Gracilimonas sp. TaxID=1974203 RepID=UPI002D959D38|nr:histidine kinase dimerization/phosphoacceptor domain -containing protein [Gracilimonas sp.]
MAGFEDKEQKRIETLSSYDILDTAEESEFDNLAKLAAQICDVPFAKINFIDNDRTWSKANYGNEIKETPKEVSFCYHTIQNDRYMVVQDTAKDDRFSNFDFVVKDPGIRFYAGVNITLEEHNLGTICVLGQEPKKLSPQQLEALRTLSKEVESRLELRKKNSDLARLTSFLEASVELMLIANPKDRSIISVNRNKGKLFQDLFETKRQVKLEDLFQEGDYMRTLKEWDKSGAKEPFHIETSVHGKDGDNIHLEISTIKKYGKWLITVQDITKRKTIENDLKQEKRFNDAIINSLPIDFYMFDEQLQLMRWNKNMTKNTGYSDEEVKQLNPLEFFGEEDYERVSEQIQKTKGGSKITLEADLVKKDGTTEPFLFNAATIESNGQRYLLGTGESIRNMREYQNKLEILLTEKDVLLGEVHHRVKNNLAVISGFLQLEEFISENEEVKQVLSNNHLRVKSMALIHEELYKAKNFNEINFGNFLNVFLKVLKDKLYDKSKNITLQLDVDTVKININQAIPLALIINELVSNAYKYAFEGREEGDILVELKNAGDKMNLKIKDDGIGLPEGFVFEESPTLGTTLVTAYSEQMDSKIDIISEEGTEYRLTFLKKNNDKGSSASAFL